jgi:DNA-binding NarL/FixJ family response regulator
MPSSIYLVEDQDILRSSLHMYVDNEDDLNVVGSAEDAPTALEEIDAQVPDLVLIDVALPGMSGISLLNQLREDHPDLACLMLSGHSEDQYVQQAVDAGAQGYVRKGDPDEYLAAIEAVLDGSTYVSDAVEKQWRRAVSDA